MNKAELINQVATSTGMSKTDATKAVTSVIESIQTSLQNGEKVTLMGFGTFETTERQARKGRNPRTGVELMIPAKKVAKFKAGAKLTNQVNG
jgi:DNA-binding protein HU-beta